jgi:hypothetical protein
MTMTHGMGGLFATHGVLLLEATCGDRVTCTFVETTDPELGLPVFRRASAET